MYRTSVFLLVTGFMTPAIAAAQTSPVATGGRVRVTTTDSGQPPHHDIGILQSVNGDTVRYLRARDSTPAMAMLGPSVHLERFAGYAAYPVLGFFLGATIGALGTINQPRGDDGGLGRASGMITAGLFGFLIGAVVHTERWAPVTVDGVAVQARANGSGFAIQLRRADAPRRWLQSAGRLSYHPN